MQKIGMGTTHRKWLNGRRSVVEVWERLQFPQAIPADGLVAHLNILFDERMILPIDPL
jgi:hypothetical protein